MGFVLVANPNYGDFIAEPIPFSVPGIMVPRVTDAQIISQYYEEQTYRDEEGLVIRYSGRAAIGEGRIATYTERAPIVSRFSSRALIMLTKTRTLLMSQFCTNIWNQHGSPHIAGIAALIKQINPSWSPSMMASAMSTTATKYDNRGEPIWLKDSVPTHCTKPLHLVWGRPCGSYSCLGPGLVFSTGYEDYLSFLCSLPNTDPEKIRTATGGSCAALFSNPSDLNQPSLTITALSGMRMTKRVVKNIASKPETYLCAVLPPEGVTVTVDPPWFTIAPQESQSLEIRLYVTQALDDFSFGEIVLTGSLNHIVRMPLSVLPISV
ncbi:UNVERIFIED_CONTAM: Subtilisin-like protease SBT2.4 [Sesamum radiatum]|uniref:Subtilisin-like protease SBT2.4 n=1 Tax=Sesamum radiatum TaxID=300843 RepID=A0AAW2KGN7_SESRA